VTERQAWLLGQLAAATGARVMTEYFTGRVRRGAGIAHSERVPYLAEFAIDALKDTEQLILIGCGRPVSFFAYPDLPSVMSPPDCEDWQLAGPGEDIDGALEALVVAVGAEGAVPAVTDLAVPPAPSGALDANSVAQALAHYLPEDAIVVDEGITAGMACFPATVGARPHDWLSEAGGSIGWGLPVAVGAAIAAPRRKVICLQGDGSAMYTIQSLWTMARERLDIVVVLLNNRKYCILELEFARTGARGGKPGPKAGSTLDIGTPDMDFAAMARSMGVPASVAATAEELGEQLERALAEPGPHLIDALIPPLQLG